MCEGGESGENYVSKGTLEVFLQPSSNEINISELSKPLEQCPQNMLYIKDPEMISGGHMQVLMQLCSWGVGCFLLSSPHPDTGKKNGRNCLTHFPPFHNPLHLNQRFTSVYILLNYINSIKDKISLQKNEYNESRYLIEAKF